MIENIEISGFKSLNDFSLEIHPGINILIGPNGSGKTNIIEFFEFMSNTIRFDLTEGISRAGGAGRVFARVSEDEFESEINVCIVGTTSTNKTRFLNKTIQPVHYRYSFTIALSQERDTIYYKHQKLELQKISSNSQSTRSHWDVIISQTIRPEFRVHIDISQLDRRKIKPRFISGNSKDALIKSLRDELLSEGLAQRPLVHAAGMSILEARAVVSDMIGGEAFNVIPSLVKRPEEIARPPGIGKDGTGLVATLYALHRSGSLKRRQLYPRYFWQAPIQLSSNLTDSIRSYLRLVNETIDNFDVRTDEYRGRLELYFAIQGAHGPINIPLTLMSDGTVKWLSLITAILTYKSIFAIEEPENYLHPAMQQEILKIMREDAGNRSENAFVIMTTHSETLLNAANPHEVIIVSMHDGRTRASRVKNGSTLRKEIQRTGFGLGYYYLAGELDDA